MPAPLSPFGYVDLFGFSRGSAMARVLVDCNHRRRRNFTLSSIRGTDGSLPADFIEEAMPDAHADVGGGYRTGLEVVNFPPRQFTWLRPEERNRQITQALAEAQQQ